MNTKEKKEVLQFIDEVLNLNASDFPDDELLRVKDMHSYNIWIFNKRLRELGQTIVSTVKENHESLFKFIIGVMSVILIYALISTMMIVVEKADQNKCYKLQDQAKEYSLWFATENEREMCNYLGIPLPPDNTRTR